MDGKERNITMRAVVLTLLPLLAGCSAERPTADFAPQGNGTSANLRYAEGAATGGRILAKPLVVTHTVMDACVAQAANPHTSFRGFQRVAQNDSVYTRGSVSMQLERLPPLADDLAAEGGVSSTTPQRLPSTVDAEQAQRLPPLEDDVMPSSPPPPQSDLANEIERERNPNRSLELLPPSRLPVVEDNSPRPHEVHAKREMAVAPERSPLTQEDVAKSEVSDDPPPPAFDRPQNELVPPTIEKDEKPVRLTPVVMEKTVAVPELIPTRPKTSEANVREKVELVKRETDRERLRTSPLLTSPAQVIEPASKDASSPRTADRDFKVSISEATILPLKKDAVATDTPAAISQDVRSVAVSREKTLPANPPMVLPENSAKSVAQGPNPALRAVASRADQICKHGMSLARRGATFSARAEFIQSLRLISQSLDAENGGNRHSQKLAAGLKALDEADDFSPQGSQLEANLNMRSTLAIHRTAILKDADPDTLLPVSAIQAYYSFGQQQIAEACGNEPSASLALFGLGKLYASMTEQPGQFGAMCGPKALAFHQAALLVDGSNFRSANELGVLLAKYGQLQPARAALLQSIATQPMPETWHNLAVVHERLGEVELATQARFEHQQAVAQASKGLPLYMPNVPIQWMTPAEFARTNQGVNDGVPTPLAGRSNIQAAAPQNPTAKPTPTAWNLWGAGAQRTK